MTRRKNQSTETTETVDQTATDETQSTSSVEPVEEPGMTQATQQQQPTKPAEAKIYIGPNLPGGKLFQFTTFKNGQLPAHVAQLIEECPALKLLLVTPSQLSTARAKLGDRSSVEATKFTEVRKHFYKGAM